MRQISRAFALSVLTAAAFAVLNPGIGAKAETPAPFSYNGFYMGVDWGFERSKFSGTTTTSFGTSGSGDASTTMNAIGLDARAHWFLADRVSLATGLWGKIYTHHDSNYLVNLDPNPPSPDTTISYRRNGFVLPYAGVAWEHPTFSSMMADKAWQPGWGTWYTTVYGGPRFDFVHGSTSTNETGLVRTSDYSKTVHGWTLGLDADYPLALSGYDSARADKFKPVIRAGFAVDWSNSYDVNHVTGLGFTYVTNIQPGPVYRGYLGVGYSWGD